MEIGGNIFERDSEGDVKILPPLFSSVFLQRFTFGRAFFQLIEVDSISEPKRVAFVSSSSLSSLRFLQRGGRIIREGDPTRRKF